MKCQDLIANTRKKEKEKVPKYKCTLARIEIQLMIIYAVRLNPFTNILPISGMQ